MKRIHSIGVLILFILAVGRPVLALAPGSHISAVTKINEGTCAVEVDTSGTLLNILPTDKLTLEGNLLATLGSLLDLQLDHLDHFLAATPSFEDLVGVDADVELDPQACVELLAGKELDLVGLGNVLDSVVLPDDFGPLTSLLIDPEGVIKLLHLSSDSTEVSNSGGSSSSVGGGDSGIGGSSGTGTTGGTGGNNGTVGTLPDVNAGGCSLNPAFATEGGNMLGWALAGAFFLLRRRK